MASIILLVFMGLLQSVLFLTSLYLLLLTLMSLGYRPAKKNESASKTRFAVLIPAHNEEAQLPGALESLLAIDYPKKLVEIFVVADNCSDSTAEIARRYGAKAFERRDLLKRGKGHALHWLLERLRQSADQFDAFVVVDADCQVSENFLNAMDWRFQNGAQVIQGYYTVDNPFASRVSALRYIALVLKHYVRPLGRARLRLSCGLFGTGMSFKHDVLAGQAWQAYTLTEDIEYYLKLTDQGITVEFAPEAVVSSEMPSSLSDSKSQNLRWERGRLQMLKQYGPRLLWKGVLCGDFRRLDAVLEQAIPPLSVTIAAVLAMLVFSFFTSQTWLIALSVATAISYLGHVFIGLASARVPLCTYRYFLHIPKYLVWKLYLYAQALLPGDQEWVRTNRR